MDPPAPPTPGPVSHGAPAPPTKPPPLVQVVVNGPNGPCLTLVPQYPQQNATVRDWLASVSFPACPPAPAQVAVQRPVLDPVTLAVQFWRTVPLPVPHPTIPPGYAITGKPAYLVTGGSTQPDPFVEQTPLGQLTIEAVGTYDVDWGDGSGWQGPYRSEGQPYPQGGVSHVYDNVGTYDVVVREQWTARWQLAGAVGTLGGLQTTATIGAYPVRQVQAVITG